MTLGYFDDEAREYVISTPKTPYPWINYLGNKDFFSLVSNTAGGYSFYRDAKFRRLTRYRYNNVPVDTGGKYFFIHDEGEVWSPSWKPVKADLDAYECRHGLGYTTITAEKNGIRCEVSYFVPLNDPVEIHRVRITNSSNNARKITLFSLVEWCLWNAEDDMSNFQRNFSTGEVEVKDSVIYHKTEYRERRNHYAYYSVNSEIAGFDTDRDSFLGNNNGFDGPDAVLAGKSSNSIAHGWSPIASHSIDVSLAAGEQKTFNFVLGYQECAPEDKWESPNVINKAGALQLIDKYRSDEDVERALLSIRQHWDENLSHFSMSSDDDRLNRMVNIWNQYQCMVTFHFSRSASFFESGIGRGMGFRDSNQDLIGVIHMAPERARERILDIAATQMRDGSAYHQYQPLTKRGNANIGGNFNDDPLWLIQSVVAYVKESGDFGILTESVPYNNVEDDCAPLFDHLTASFNHVVNNLGPHGLPLIGRADWNDCLNLNCFSSDPNESFQTTENSEGKIAESVLIAGMFMYFGGQYADLCRYLEKHEEVDRATQHLISMSCAIDRHGWDGEWFLRAYDSTGEKIGSKDNDEGQIFVESQGFCVMAGLGADDGRAVSALDSVKEHLSCDFGVVLCSPAYTRYHLNLGEISTYPPGYKENGGIFCHNNPWIVIAETKLKRADEAFAYYKKICPAYLDDKIELHKTEPYVYSQMIAGKEAPTPGQAKNSWLTGTAAWNYHAITEHILGIKPDFDSLIIDPCLPSDVDQIRIARKFRGASYNVLFRRGANKPSDAINIHLDGVPVHGNRLPLQSPGTTCDVIVDL